ncbi:YhfX family PLP-dependent enzyme [Thaumasiovibrio sp. DFM-14]|uniref:YhfX family PLP-dependent enzyme n=1 Tax=Thaumasiovibrio sp. DFM-14 TaxID=3384792 RepID=UPI0039A1B1F0
MFLDALERQNSNLVAATLSLFSQGKLLPDTTVIDVDQLLENAKAIKSEANRYGVRLYAMTKQFGRNPLLAKMLIQECGYEGIVCVDFKEARLMASYGLPIGNIGHLVQPPTHMIPAILTEMKPEVVTVYSLEKARQISEAAQQAGRIQGILLKFYRSTDHLYVNQESGFPIEKLESVVEAIAELPGVHIAGVTHFPCFLYSPEKKATAPTPNLTTLVEAKKRLKRLGIECEQVNVPSSTCVDTISKLAEHGGTHGEPGHSLTGTFPANVDGTQTERVASLYLSEISHHYEHHSYCFGGGYYRRGMMANAFVVDGKERRRVSVFNDDKDSIDYHLRIPGHYPIGSPVIMAFRSQVFVTRSDVVLLRDVATPNPKVLAIFDALGNEVAYG